MWTKEQIVVFCKSRAVITSALCAASGSLSAAVAVGVVKKRLELQYKAILEEEIASVKRQYSREYKTGEFVSPETAAAAEVGVTNVTNNYYAPETNVPLTKEQLTALILPEDEKLEEEQAIAVEQHNVFDKTGTQPLNYDEEIAARGEDAPYVISFQEFIEEEDYDQTEVTYYVNDDLLVDDKDVVLPNVDEVTGIDNLLRFGDGSEDPDVVYIKNDKFQLVYCVVKTEASFAEVVHGVSYSDDHLAHSAPRKMRAYRDE